MSRDHFGNDQIDSHISGKDRGVYVYLLISIVLTYHYIANIHKRTKLV